MASYWVVVNDDEVVLGVYGDALEKMADAFVAEIRNGVGIGTNGCAARKLFIGVNEKFGTKPYVGQKL